jgi:hypothetical protein
MLGLNIFSLLFLIGVIAFAIKTTKKDEITQNKTVNRIASLLLIINIIKLIVDPSKIPVEFSAVTYFTTPLIILLKIKKLQVWAVYSSLMAGIFYYLTMMSGGGVIYALKEPVNVYIALLCHGVLLYIGIVKVKTILLKRNQLYKLAIGVLLILVWSLYMRTQVIFTERLFIYELIDAGFVTNLGYTNQLIIVCYYIALTLLVLLSFRLLFFFNKVLYRNHSRRYIQARSQIKYLDVTQGNKLNYT